jgi:hypothetical protein
VRKSEDSDPIRKALVDDEVWERVESTSSRSIGAGWTSQRGVRDHSKRCCDVADEPTCDVIARFVAIPGGGSVGFRDSVVVDVNA